MTDEIAPESVRRYALLNGTLVPEDVASLPVDDRGARYGESVFTTIRLYRGRPFRLQQHVARLAETLANPLFGFSYAVQEAALKRDIATLVRRNEVYEGTARFMVTAGAGDPRTISLQGETRPTTLLEVKPYWPKDGLYADGARAYIGSVCRMRGSLFAQHKLGAYMPYMVARREAVAKGYDEGLILDESGTLLEGAFSNLFLVRDNMLITPHAQREGVLPGIARALTLEMAGRLRILTSQEPITHALLHEAQEAFLTNSLVEILPLRQIAGYEFQTIPGMITKRLMNEYNRVVEEETSGL